MKCPQIKSFVVFLYSEIMSNRSCNLCIISNISPLTLWNDKKTLSHIPSHLILGIWGWQLTSLSVSFLCVGHESCCWLHSAPGHYIMQFVQSATAGSIQATSMKVLVLSHSYLSGKCPADNELYMLPSTAHIIQHPPLSPLQSPMINIFLIVNHLCQLLVIIDT